MSEHHNFINSFFRVLNQQGKYAFFDYQLNGQANLNNHSLYDLLIQPATLEQLLTELRQFEGVSGLSVSSRFSHSQVLINFDDGDFMMINFTHRFIYKSLVYLNAEEVLDRNTFNPSKGYVQPSIEHLFEFAILKQYLRFEGWNEQVLAFFRDFHVLIKEDLLEFFNFKYGTRFSDLDDIVDFNVNARNAMIDQIKTLPANEFLKSINVRWHNFVGYMRQAKII